ncbi:hypothetical protein [Streptomyces sp. NPDC001389]|uniref:hypothetical protein n=1 Tax=Streptomyces sp. NPDC001389 TaxID=3364569 RepID=UPI0036916016
MSHDETWTLSEVAAFLGYRGDKATGSARRQLSRWGVKARGRAAGRGGESYFDIAEVKAAYAARPGRGRRTDLKDQAPAKAAIDTNNPKETTS